MKCVDIAAKSIVAEGYVRKWTIISSIKRKRIGVNIMQDEVYITDEQKEFRELLQDLLMEQQEQM